MRERGVGRILITGSIAGFVFAYLVKAEALDSSGGVLLTGVVDIYLRNRHEELKASNRRLQLQVVYHPEPDTEPDGSRVIDVVLKNLDDTETANLTSLEVRHVRCTPGPEPPSADHRPVADVFRASSVRPRGSGRLRWPKDGSPEVCHLDVSVEGASQPGGLVVGGAFSMRVGFDQGAEAVADPDQSAAIQKAMAILHKKYVTPEDLERLVASGDLPPSALKKPGPRLRNGSFPRRSRCAFSSRFDRGRSEHRRET